MNIKNFILILLLVAFIIPIVEAGFFDWLSGDDSNLAGKAVYESDKGGYAESSLKLGGNTYKVVSSSDINSNDFSIKADINGDGSIGTYSVNIVGDELDIISKDSYFYLKNYGLMRYRGASKITEDNPTIKFQDVKSGEVIERVYSGCSLRNAESSLKLGGNTYKVVSSSDINSNDFSVKVDISGDGILGNYDRAIVSDESDVIAKDVYFYLYDYGLLRYEGADKISADAPVIKFQDVKTGNTIERSISTCTINAVEATLNVASVTYNLASASNPSQNDFKIIIQNIYGMTYDIIGGESEIINKNDYFYLKGIGMFRYKGADKVTADAPVITFQDINTGETIERSISGNEGEEIGSIKYGGNTFKIVAASATTSNDFDIKIDLDASGTIGDYEITIFGKTAAPLLQKDEYVLLNDRKTLLQYKGADKYTVDSPTIKFKNVITGNVIETAYEGCPDTSAKATIILNGKTYSVKSTSDTSSNDFNINVDLNGDGTIGNYERNIIGSELVSVKKEDYVYLNSYGLIRYKGADKSTSDNPVIKFQDLQTGETIEISYPACSTSGAETTILVGGKSYKVISASDTSSTDFDIKVDMDASGSIGNYDLNIVSSETSSINKDNYLFLINYGLIRYKGADKSTSDNPVIKFQDVGTGETIEIAYKILSKEEVPSEEKPIEQPEQKPAPCNGCLLNEKCIPYGNRIKNQYCDLDSTLKDQKSKEGSCNNNYECKSNICVNDNCIEPNFIQKIIDWFKKLFGG